MSIANLKKYILSIDDDGEPYLLECKGGFVVKFEEAKEASLNNIQQLKAEIAALANRLESEAHGGLISSFYTIQALRQLSAI